jgi:hypothetical protein
MRLASSAVTLNSSMTMGTSPGGAGGSGGGAAGQQGSILPTGTQPAADFDGDELTDEGDKCLEIPRGGTDANADGCPDRPAALPDDDGDGVPNDGRDACPSLAATIDANHDGCTDEATTTGTTTTGTTTTGTTTTSRTTTTTITTTVPGAAPPGGGASRGGRGTVTLSLSRQRLRTALTRGLVVQAGCAQACRLTGALRVDRRLARRLRVLQASRPVTVATGAANAPAGRTARLTLRFTKKAKIRLRRSRSVPMTLAVTGSTSNGAATTTLRRLTLKR